MYFASDCVALEHAVRGGAAGVDDPLGDALVVEVRDLLPEDEVLPQGGTSQAGLERALVVGDGLAEVRREPAAGGVDAHPVEGRVPGLRPGSAGAPVFGDSVCSVSVLAVTEASAGSAVAPGFGARARVADLVGLVPVEGEGRRQRLRLLHASAAAPSPFALTGASARAAHGRLGGAFSRGRGLSGLGHAMHLTSARAGGPPSVVVEGCWESPASRLQRDGSRRRIEDDLRAVVGLVVPHPVGLGRAGRAAAGGSR